MKTSLTFVLTAALAASGCATKDDDIDSRLIPGRITPPGGGEDSDLPDPTVAFLGEITPPRLRSAAAIAVDTEGTIFISDPVARLVHKVTAHGDPLWTISVGDPQGVAVDGAGRLYVSDAAAGAVRIYSPNAELVGFLGAGEGTFGSPVALAWDPVDDAILVADHDDGRIHVYSTTGASISDFGSRGDGPGQFARVSGIVVDGDGGRYFIADSGLSRIQVFDRAGTFLREFGSRGTGKTALTAPGGIALDGAGRLYVSDAYQSILQVLDTDGKHVSYLGEYGQNFGQLRLTSDAALDPFNRLLVASYKTKKIVVYGIDEFTQPPRRMPPIVATLAAMPPTLNGRSRSPFLHARIGVTQLDVRDILIDTVRLHGLARAPSAPVTYEDANGDGFEELILRFSREAMLAALPGPGPHTLSLVGDFNTGDTLIGEVVVHVLAEAE